MQRYLFSLNYPKNEKGKIIHISLYHIPEIVILRNILNYLKEHRYQSREEDLLKLFHPTCSLT